MSEAHTARRRPWKPKAASRVAPQTKQKDGEVATAKWSTSFLAAGAGISTAVILGMFWGQLRKRPAAESETRPAEGRLNICPRCHVRDRIWTSIGLIGTFALCHWRFHMHVALGIATVCGLRPAKLGPEMLCPLAACFHRPELCEVDPGQIWGGPRARRRQSSADTCCRCPPRRSLVVAVSVPGACARGNQGEARFEGEGRPETRSRYLSVEGLWERSWVL